MALTVCCSLAKPFSAVFVAFDFGVGWYWLALKVVYYGRSSLIRPLFQFLWEFWYFKEQETTPHYWSDESVVVTGWRI